MKREKAVIAAFSLWTESIATQFLLCGRNNHGKYCLYFAVTFSVPRMTI